MLIIIVVMLIIEITLEFLTPEYLKIFISLFLNSSIKKSCVDIKNIKGNISKRKEGEFINAKYIIKYPSTLIFLKKSNSLTKFKINIRHIKIITTNKKDFIKLLTRNEICFCIIV